MRLPTNDALAALGGIVVNRDRLPGTIAVSTDTRAIRPSETFLALRGERFDGHRFVTDAVASGASAVIVAPSVRLSLVSSRNAPAAGPSGACWRGECATSGQIQRSSFWPGFRPRLVARGSSTLERNRSSC